ncbi:hypothetical protein [Mycobacteroides abscessus]|uniref:hypothetical protein n=1 Tax=Mycobacteroides abscessus TaxID=36809 RepID=UPI0019D30791|nr:hypothetical protein [Mycobacteroides abscessus]MBN7451025.1 hypothetical protein [Mycobacteroides abscessus subsp. abscessus]
MRSDREDQSRRLSEALEQAARAKAQALEDQPWSTLCDVYATMEGEGGVASVAKPEGTELMGRRLAFELLSYCDSPLDAKRVFEDHIARLGAPAHILSVLAAALTVMSMQIVPEMVDQLERLGDFDTRVNLADAARIAWSLRLEGGSV